MSKSPRVSAIVPNYNYAQFLDRRLKSILHQTYTDFEIIYHDDCSTDGSEAVFAKYRSHPKIRAYANETNSGNAYAPINKCVALARGDYIWVTQADDYAEATLLETLVPILDEHPYVGIAYCQSLVVDDDSVVLGSFASRRKFPDSDRWDHDFINKGMDEIRRYLLFWNTIPNLSGVLFRKDLFDAVGGADERLPLAADWLMYISMLQRSDIAFVAKPLNSFRHHGGSVREQSGYEKRFSEAYLVLQFVRDHLDLPEEDMESAYEHLMKMWRKRVFGKQKTGRWSSAQKIYAAARKVDPYINKRFARHVFKAYTIDVVKKLMRG